MTYARFEELWTALVKNRPMATSATPADKAVFFNNGVSDKLVDALVAEADDNTAIFDEVKSKLSAMGA